MIKKIISGGQTGADQAALDAAIQFNIPHGGWIPKGRITEAGRLSDKYKLMEMPTKSYQKRTEQNIIDSDGTLIVSHGPLTGGSKLTQEKAGEFDKPFLHIDLDKMSIYDAAHVVKIWAEDNYIETLNVAGSRLSKDNYIYTPTLQILSTVLHLEQKESGNFPDLLLDTVDAAVDRLIDILPLKEKTQISKLEQDDLILLHPTLGAYIRNEFLWDGNKSLMIDCIHRSGKDVMDEDGACALIIEVLWNKLKETHRLRIVK